MVRPWIALPLLVVLVSFSAGVAGGEVAYVVSANHPVKVAVNGVEKAVPAYVKPGDLVCAPETVYQDDGVRLAFRGWEGAGRDACVRASGNLTATYVREFLIHVYAQPTALRRSVWVEEGTFLSLDYPGVFNESAGVRWVFQSWSVGETPFQPSNRVYVTRPLRVEAAYVREFRLVALATHGVVVNGSGWYREGVLAVVAGPREVYVSNATRLVLTEWVSAGSVPVIIMQQASPGVAVLEVRGPHMVMARYRAEHFVTVTGPQGVIYNGWAGEGEELKLSTPEYIGLGQDARLRFSGWRGVEGFGPQLSLRVSGPVRAEAAYVKQYLLSVSSPVGAAGAGWYDEGAKAVVSVPENPPANVFVKRRLAGFSGECGECVHDRGRMILTMDMPRSVTAVYASEPDIINLGILAGVVAIGGITYAAGRRRPKKGVELDDKEAKISLCRVCGSEVPEDAAICPDCGARLTMSRPTAAREKQAAMVT